MLYFWELVRAGQPTSEESLVALGWVCPVPSASDFIKILNSGRGSGSTKGNFSISYLLEGPPEFTAGFIVRSMCIPLHLNGQTWLWSQIDSWTIEEVYRSGSWELLDTNLTGDHPPCLPWKITWGGKPITSYPLLEPGAEKGSSKTVSPFQGTQKAEVEIKMCN